VNAPTPPPAWYPDPSRAPGLRYWDGQQWTGYTRDTASAQPAPNKRTRWIAVGIAVVAAIGLFATVIINMYRTEAAYPQIVLPFTGLYNPWAVAVDTTGTVYVADYFTSQVLKLAAGSSTQTVLPFTGLVNPEGVAVDTAGTVYIADHGNNRVVKLAAGSSSQTVLPFTSSECIPGCGGGQRGQRLRHPIRQPSRGGAGRRVEHPERPAEWPQ
jgi:DNA-binding beta-propeller fold protein YncE